MSPPDPPARRRARPPRADAVEVPRPDKVLFPEDGITKADHAHTAVAPYAVRPLPGAPVAAPIPWEDLSDPDLRPRRHRLGALPAPLLEDGGPWRDLPRRARPLGAARRRLDALRAEAPVP